MPSPTETLLRSQDSPVPTQTISGFEGSIATAPIDCTSWRSKTGLKVVPPFTDFQTPPLAEPTNIVSRPFRTTASRAAMRPLIVAEPMLRAGRPETVAASNFSGCCARTEEARKTINREVRTARVQRAEAVIYDPRWTVNLLMRARLRTYRRPHILNSWPFPVSWVLLSARPVKQNQSSPAVYLLQLFCTSRSAMNWDRSWARPLPRTETSRHPQAYRIPDQ